MHVVAGRTARNRRWILRAAAILFLVVFHCLAAVWCPRRYLAGIALVAVIALILLAIFLPRLFTRTYLAVLAVSVLLGVIPIDVKLERTGSLGVRSVPIVHGGPWDMDNEDLHERDERGEIDLRGDVVHGIHPPERTIVFSY